MSVIPRFIPNAHESPRLHLPHLKYKPGAATVELRFRLRPHQSRAVTLLQICKKTTIYNTNIDLVNDNVFTKFGLILSIRSQDIEQKPNSDINQGP